MKMALLFSESTICSNQLQKANPPPKYCNSKIMKRKLSYHAFYLDDNFWKWIFYGTAGAKFHSL